MARRIWNLNTVSLPKDIGMLVMCSKTLLSGQDFIKIRTDVSRTIEGYIPISKMIREQRRVRLTCLTLCQILVLYGFYFMFEFLAWELILFSCIFLGLAVYYMFSDIYFCEMLMQLLNRGNAHYAYHEALRVHFETVLDLKKNTDNAERVSSNESSIDQSVRNHYCQLRILSELYDSVECAYARLVCLGKMELDPFSYYDLEKICRTLYLRRTILEKRQYIRSNNYSEVLDTIHAVTMQNKDYSGEYAKKFINYLKMKYDHNPE